jgi:hypothetical protein
MTEVEVVEVEGGWRIVTGQKNGADIVVEAIGATLKDNRVRAVLTVRVGDSVAFKDSCSLTSQRSRAKVVTALQAKGISVDDGVLVALDEACRRPPRRAAAASATGPDATRTVPLPDLLGEIEAIVSRYVMISADALTAIVLWIAHTYALDAFDVTPYLNVTSPAKRCGKSRLLEVLEGLTRAAWLVIRPSEAVLFRKIGRDQPTMLLDEVDAIFKDRSASTEGLRAVLNAGNRRGVTVPRCVGDQHELVDFPVFCAKVTAGIGRVLPDTVRDRGIEVQLLRKKPGETLPKLRQAILRQETAPVRKALATWASTTVIDAFRIAAPIVPDELHDRAADAWEPLLAIADSAGGDWPTRARNAARALHCADLDKDNVGVLLLRAIRDEFDAAGVDRLLTADLLRRLIERDGEPWGAWWGPAIAKDDVRGPGFKLATQLREYGIMPKEMRTATGKGKGYERADFEDAFARYATAPDPTLRATGAGPSPNDATTRHSAPDTDFQTEKDATASDNVASPGDAETLGAEDLSRCRVVNAGVDSSIPVGAKSASEAP